MDGQLLLPLCSLPNLQELWLYIISLEQMHQLTKHEHGLSTACDNIKLVSLTLGDIDDDTDSDTGDDLRGHIDSETASDTDSETLSDTDSETGSDTDSETVGGTNSDVVLKRRPYDWIPDLIEHFSNVKHLFITTDADLTSSDWSDVRLPHLQCLSLKGLQILFSSFQQIVSCNKSTLSIVSFEMTDFTGGTFADLFLELDTPEIITLEADCCSFADQAWTERDQDEGKLFGDRINARRSVWGCIPPFSPTVMMNFVLASFTQASIGILHIS
jgi:hypothetical protein